ncbi:orotidine-5'-phosphate decarboxylase [Mucisphaera sp.]|uniref:orotidine-5'-phosphate decarboxylase n=1 Tax=Mucisphaera sp. TaxID=2913024 RepID=UPI003D100DB2
MSEHFADRLQKAIDVCGAPVCVGLDPVLERLPVTAEEPLAAIETFCEGVLEAVAGVVPVVKFQSACFERYGWRGVRLLESLLVRGRERGVLSINDAKRGDIAISASHYAEALLGQADSADALTINGYLGQDSIEPFVEVAKREGAGLFVLVRTSNPGGDALQATTLAGGGTVASCLAEIVRACGAGLLGDQTGLSCVGAVVGATKADEAERLRAVMPEQIFLLPGFGAQGGDAKGLRRFATAEGRGLLVTASRSVIYPGGTGSDWRGAIRLAAERMRDEVAAALG